MINLTEKIADSYRQQVPARANPNNKVTRKRRRLYEQIKSASGGDNGKEIEQAMNIISQQRPRIENYVMSKGEIPANDIQDLVIQAYQLRSKEIDNVSSMLGCSEGEANIFIEDDEAETELANNYEAENFVGELFAPIGIVASNITEDNDNFIDAGLVSGAISTIGGKLDSAALKRAAQDKKSGIVGFLTGGKKEYEQLRQYLQDPKNKDEKDLVLKGVIKDVSQLRGYGAAIANNPAGIGGIKVGGKDVIDELAKLKKREAISKALPFIVIGVVAIVLVTVLIVKNANKGK